MERKPQLLVVDDGDAYARILTERMPEFDLVRPADGVDCLPDGPAALSYLSKNARKVDLVLLDMHFDVPEDRLFPLGGTESLRRRKRFQGAAILRELRRRHPDLPVVLLTSVEDLSLVDAEGEIASQSMTYFLDSDDLDSLRIRIVSALRQAALGLEETNILWGRSQAMRQVRNRLAVLARGRMPVIVEGETGTGKSFLAREFIHANADRSGPFVTIDLSAIPENLVSAELFGAKRGAYTGATADRQGAFEQADKGTLFLDEVQNVPLDVQKQLLIVLQEGRVRPLGAPRDAAVDVKVVAASNAPLDRAVAEGRFRHDLYMRLSPATRVVIPPLRDRPEDLVFLAHRFPRPGGRGAGRAEPDRRGRPRARAAGRRAGQSAHRPREEGRGRTGLDRPHPPPPRVAFVRAALVARQRTRAGDGDAQPAGLYAGGRRRRDPLGAGALLAAPPGRRGARGRPFVRGGDPRTGERKRGHIGDERPAGVRLPPATRRVAVGDRRRRRAGILPSPVRNDPRRFPPDGRPSPGRPGAAPRRADALQPARAQGP